MYSKNGNAVSRVLVADDDPVIRRWLASILEDEGYAVVSMDDGRAAFRTLQSDADFSAAVFDMSMPYLQGLDLIRYMRTEKRLMRIPVMMITAETDISTLATCFSAGATVLLPKPFTRNRLQQTLRLMLGENSSVNRLVGKTSLPTFTRNIPEIAPQQTSSVSAIVDRDEYQTTVVNRTVDLSIVNDLDQYTKDGETSLVVELIDLYLENTARQISEIKSALENKKQEGLKQAAHALKGSSLTMGARGVGKICDQLERERVGSPLVAGLLVLLEREFASTAEIFKNERQKRLFPVAA